MIVETSQCWCLYCFFVPAGVGGLAVCCRRSLTYGYGRLRLSDAVVGGNLFMISVRFVSFILVALWLLNLYFRFFLVA